MDYNNILEQARRYVRSFFDTHGDEKIIYHNRTHTEKVAQAAMMIAQHYQLNEKDFFIVNVAAWFHDIGYYKGGAPGHEEKGAQMAEAFLTGTGVDASVMDSVKGCILATKLPQRPTNLLEEIVCDADLFHLGTDEFGERNKLLRKEAEATHHKKISKDQWRKDTIRFLESHHYHTDYCQLLLNEKKQENLDALKAKDPEPESTDPVATLLHRHEEAAEEREGIDPEKKDKKGKKENGKKDAGRGIDTVFRITSNNNQRLSSQADSKAHILIQVNSIIISVLLSLLLRKIEDHTNLAIPATLLLAVNLLTIIFSILATRPHIPPGTFSKADLDEKKVNLLFFGNFYKMSLPEYANGMLQMMDDRDFLYGSLIRDVYFQGIALGKKYRWLRLSYNVFMYGLILSVLAFLVAALAFPSVK
ncbi:MAG TPA: Pycsar system effector family protein [Puia sp.]|jgi:predicted metal-dependent HD superfamily phosphohydrolase|nr:Pycsar system effector family protein [Puia sp.]